MYNLYTAHHLCIGEHPHGKHSWDDIYYLLKEMDERFSEAEQRLGIVENLRITGGVNYDPNTEELKIGYSLESEE